MASYERVLRVDYAELLVKAIELNEANLASRLGQFVVADIQTGADRFDIEEARVKMTAVCGAIFFARFSKMGRTLYIVET